MAITVDKAVTFPPLWIIKDTAAGTAVGTGSSLFNAACYGCIMFAKNAANQDVYVKVTNLAAPVPGTDKYEWIFKVPGNGGSGAKTSMHVLAEPHSTLPLRRPINFSTGFSYFVCDQGGQAVGSAPADTALELYFICIAGTETVA